MQVNLNDERERIARIIDPDNTYASNGGHVAYMAWQSALTKADAIIALRTKEPSRG